MPDLCCITVQCKIAQNAPYSVIMQSLQSASAFGSGSTTTSRASKSFPDCRRAQCILNHLWQENTRPDTRESAHQKVWFASNHILCSNIVCEPVQPNLCKPWPWHLLPAQRPRLITWELPELRKHVNELDLNQLNRPMASVGQCDSKQMCEIIYFCSFDVTGARDMLRFLGALASWKEGRKEKNTQHVCSIHDIAPPPSQLI